MGLVTIPPSPFPPSSGKTGDIVERVTELENDVSTLQTNVGTLQTNVGTLGTTKAPKTDIAPAFSAETNYTVGDLVYYDGALYECTTEHTAGEWNSEHFTATAINTQLNEINSNIATLNNIAMVSKQMASANGRYYTLNISNMVTTRFAFQILATPSNTGTKSIGVFINNYNSANEVYFTDNMGSYDPDTKTITIDLGSEMWVAPYAIYRHGFITFS